MPRKKTPPKPPACESPTRTVPLSALTPDPDNPRTHDARNLQIITESLRRFGQVEALVVQRGTLRVIGGNGRLEAMRSLGWTECEVREVAVDDHEAKALGAVLNRSAETAGWDAERLAGVLDELRSIDFDLDLFGFSYEEIDALIAGVDEGSGVGGRGSEETPNGVESDTDQDQAGTEETMPEGYKVLISCPDEISQTALLERLPTLSEELGHAYDYRAMVT